MVGSISVEKLVYEKNGFSNPRCKGSCSMHQAENHLFTKVKNEKLQKKFVCFSFRRPSGQIVEPF